MRSAHSARLDIIVQNAGIYPWTMIENIAPEEWDRVLAVNLQRHASSPPAPPCRS